MEFLHSRPFWGLDQCLLDGLAFAQVPGPGLRLSAYVDSWKQVVVVRSTSNPAANVGLSVRRAALLGRSIGAAFELTDGLSRLEKGTKRLSPGPAQPRSRVLGKS